MSAAQLHELFDARAGTIERFDDRAIARLAVEGGEQAKDLDLFEAPFRAPRDHFGQPQGSADVVNRSAPILKPVVSSALIAESVRRRVAGEPVRVAAPGGELAAFVELPPLAPRRKAEIRTDGRNVETFDRLRFWAYAQIGEYRCGPRETWDEVVASRALAIAEEVRAAYPDASHAYSDAEAPDTAKSVAGWVWSRYDGGQLTRVRVDAAVRPENDRKRAVEARRARGALPRDVWLDQIQQRRVAAAKLRGLGVAVDEIARRLSAGVRSVQRWISEIGTLVRSAPSPSAHFGFLRDRLCLA